MGRVKEPETNRIIKTCRDLRVYQLSYDLAMEIFGITKLFPKEETYALTDQMRRSSRSIPGNIAEGWAKRKYPNVFIRHLFDANGPCEETKTWLSFGLDCGYLSKDVFAGIFEKYNEVGAMLNSLIKNWKTL